MDISRATEVTPEVEDAVGDMFTYHNWTPEMIDRGYKVRQALASAVLVIVANVPPGPDRSVAIRKIREARMDANSAISFNGRW